LTERLAPFDPRRILASPWAYRAVQALVRGDASYRKLVERHLPVRPGERVLDVGCGPADLRAYLPADADYVGFDASPRYVAWARRRYGDRARILCQTLERVELEALGLGSFDWVVAYGLVHHLDDREAADFFALARAALRPGGRLVTIDGCFAPDQSRLVRWLLRHDRGRHVRTEAAYRALAATSFPSVVAHVRRDLLRLPYTLIVLECTAP
jgi:cyclopropane fatty-acyl-phospholipid synthase-like methyltransferase